MFKNRIDEVNLLEDLYHQNKPKLIVLYGKRRVGKTELLNEFARKHKALYIIARQESEKDQLEKLSNETANFFNDKVLDKNPFQNYDAFFTYLAENAERTPIFFDEFPYLVESNKALPSILQEYWDKYFSKKNSFIVLCGSSITMMESLLGYKSPIYGRRTEQILLEPMKFRSACEFFGRIPNDKKVLFYSILGGTPAYLLEFDYSKSLKHNLKENILKKNKFLYQDTLFVLREELNEPRNYFSIIHSISKGNTSLGHIVNDTGLDKGVVTKYLSVLIDLQLIERKIPITEKSPSKSRKGIYLLKDNYFRFWFRFVFGNNDYIEQNRQEKLIEEKIMPQLNSFVGYGFEDLSRDWVKEQNQFRDYLIGTWWDKNEEIDIVGIDKASDRILFGEVKWVDLSRKKAENIIKKLKQKAKMVKWGNDREEKFMLIAKRIESKKELARQGVLLFELDDVVR